LTVSLRTDSLAMNTADSARFLAVYLDRLRLLAATAPVSTAVEPEELF